MKDIQIKQKDIAFLIGAITLVLFIITTIFKINLSSYYRELSNEYFRSNLLVVSIIFLVLSFQETKANHKLYKMLCLTLPTILYTNQFMILLTDNNWKTNMDLFCVANMFSIIGASFMLASIINKRFYGIYKSINCDAFSIILFLISVSIGICYDFHRMIHLIILNMIYVFLSCLNILSSKDKQTKQERKNE